MEHARYKIKTPTRYWYVVGVLAATLLPVFWGILNVWPLIQYILQGCDGVRSGDCWGPNHFVRNKPLWIPVYLTFIFGTIFAAFLGLLKVRRRLVGIKKPFSFGIIGLQSASWAHLGAAIMYFIYLFQQVSLTSSNSSRQYNGSDSFGEYLMIVFAGALIHLFLWVFITIPLGIICGMIFKIVAVQDVEP